MERDIAMSRAVKYLLIALTLIVCLCELWWLYGEPLSEESSYKLASDHISDFANKNGIELNQYKAPSIKHQKSEIYTFEWASKDGSKPLTVVVDPRRVEVYMDD
jgi:hypothetical protein